MLREYMKTNCNKTQEDLKTGKRKNYKHRFGPIWKKKKPTDIDHPLYTVCISVSYDRRDVCLVRVELIAVNRRNPQNPNSHPLFRWEINLRCYLTGVHQFLRPLSCVRSFIRPLSVSYVRPCGFSDIKFTFNSYRVFSCCWFGFAIRIFGSHSIWVWNWFWAK